MGRFRRGAGYMRPAGHGLALLALLVWLGSTLAACVEPPVPPAPSPGQTGTPSTAGLALRTPATPARQIAPTVAVATPLPRVQPTATPGVPSVRTSTSTPATDSLALPTAAVTTTRESQRPVDDTPSLTFRPPPATLKAGNQEQTAGVGTFCWQRPGKPGGAALCADMIGVPTARDPLRAGLVLSGTLRLPLSEPPAELALFVYPVTATQELEGSPSGAHWWPGAPATARRYELMPAVEAPINIDLETGLYVLSVFARWPAHGDVTYGFLVAAEPRAAPAGERQPVPLGRLAYVQGGDIWAKALPGGVARQVTQGGGYRAPRWSPSGEWLAAIRQGTGTSETWLMRSDGSAARQLEDCGSAARRGFAWSPAADLLACIGEDGALRATGVSLTDRVVLAPSGSGAPGTGVTGLAWSPDGQWVAYTRLDATGGTTGEARQASLWRVRANGSERSELLVDAGTPAASYELAGWTAGGASILYWLQPQFSSPLLAGGAELLELPAGGGAPISVARPVLPYDDYVVAGAAGGEFAALVIGGGRESWRDKLLTVYRLGAGSPARLLSWSQLAASSPAWAPDACLHACPTDAAFCDCRVRLAVAALPAPVSGPVAAPSDSAAGEVGPLQTNAVLDQRRIYLLDGGSAPVLLTGAAEDGTSPHRDEYPAWSRDGEWLLYVRVDGNERASVWLAPATGGPGSMVADALTQEPNVRAYYGGEGTVQPYFGHMDWSALLDWWQSRASGS